MLPLIISSTILLGMESRFSPKLKENQAKNSMDGLFLTIDSPPKSSSDLPQTSCACAVQLGAHTQEV